MDRERRDRLRVLLPNDPNNYYRERDLLPPDLMGELHKAKIIITNFHGFKPREKVRVGRLNKQLLGAGESGAFTESPDEMVRRVCRRVRVQEKRHRDQRRGPPLLQAEAGRRVPGDETQGRPQREADVREEEARVWISGLESVKNKMGLKVVYDLSATPFFLRGSGYPEGDLFPVGGVGLFAGGCDRGRDRQGSPRPGGRRLHVSREEIDAAIARYGDKEVLYDQAYEDSRRLRVTGPFTVESLSPHRVVDDSEIRLASEMSAQSHFEAGGFEATIIENLRKAGVQNTKKDERLMFERLEPYAGKWIQAEGEYTDADGKSRRVAVSMGPEHGTVGPQQVKQAAKEAVQGIGFDMLVVCGFAFDPHVSEEAKHYGALTVLPTRINPDLALGEDLLKKTGSGNLFMVFGEPDLEISDSDDQIVLEIKGSRHL